MKKRILSLLLAIVMVLSILPAPINAVDVDTTADSDSVVGKFAKVTSFGYGEARQDPNYAGNMVTSDHYPELLVITGVAVVGSTTYYQLSAAEGYTWPAISNAADGWYLESTKVVVLEPCGICGKTGCTAIHFYCDRCLKYDCGKDHLHCPACGEVDCTKTHTWCGLCGDYDCGIEHEDIAPNTVPIIPDNPTLTGGAEVSIVDEYGDPVTEEGFLLFEGVKSSLSAWSGLGENARYQWQIRYDSENDLWADIQGQRGKGILLSPAMVLSIIEDQGCTAVRCTVTAGDETLTSAAIPVNIAQQAVPASFMLTSGASAVAETDDSDELQKSYVVVQYVYSDGRTAAATDFAEIIPGNSYSHNYTLPVIPGYKATLNTHSYGESVALNNNTLVMNFAENALTGEYTIFTVTYVPDYVSYTVIHYWQNVDNDNYTEHARETISTTHKTGDVITDAHKSYPGFYNLLYETPAAAADGSTVIEVYYDRYYYLMTFALGDMGYGVDPIYARYGADIEIGTPTRAGYTFLGWSLDGETATVPSTMPAENREYVALWQAAETAKVSVVFWGENPDDEGYSYIKTTEITAQTGSTLSWDSWCFSCGYRAHTHNALCGYNCGKKEHIHSLNSCYELTCTITSHSHEAEGCSASKCSHTHGLGCIFGCSHEHGDECYDCGKAELIHSHTILGGCYKLTCSKEEHPHSDSCGYNCGVTEEHIHTSSCGTDQSGMEANLWTFVRSKEVTVAADGSTVINVYYDRTSFTLTFKVDAATVQTITEKWGADIREQFPIVGTDGTEYRGMEWNVPSGCQSFDSGYNVLSIDIMPPENITFDSEDQSDEASLYYYIEALPGTANTYPYNNREYILYKTVYLPNSGYLTEAEEFHDIAGFTKGEYTPSGIFSSYSGVEEEMWLFYTRNSYAIEFYDPSELIKKSTGVLYESNLGGYDYTPTADEAPEKYAPGSVKFAGWYLNPDCTGEQYILADHTMPAATNNGDTAIALYAKWEPVEHKVNYYLTRDSLDRDENIPTEMARLVQEAVAAGAARPTTDPYTSVFAEKTVQHGDYIGEPGDPEVAEGYENIHPRAGYDFIGWFYLNEDGEEAAFDPENMPVHQNLDLYAKWSSNVLCYYNVYFALDENADGKADVDAEGNIIYVADPISGSAIAGRTYTFAAKGGEDLYDPDGDVNYQEGYFPTVGSHSIVIDIKDEEGTGANSFTFLYRPKTAVPYMVKYLDKDTGAVLFEDKVISNNKNVVVTENFLYKQGYMPDAYQKTLVVTDDGDASNDVIIFYYTKDEDHALYVVNYYIQELDSELNHAGWTKYTDLQYTGDIDTAYSAGAITIDGFTLSAEYTDGYNTTQKINGMDGTALPAVVSELVSGKITGTLTDKGMELNFYYTRNLYPYEFRYMLNGTTTELADPEFGKAGYDSIVTMGAKEIVMDLDGDGNNEDYRLYNPTETTKDIHIIVDGKPLAADAQAAEGQAKVNVATFYYVRCTQTMHITKQVVDNSAESSPDPDQTFTFSLLIHAKNGYHQSTYAYTKSDGTQGTLSPEITAPNTLKFTLKAGQTITIEGLPTAEYTVSEQNVPLGYYDTYAPARGVKLTVDRQVDVTVTNTYAPAVLEISKSVEIEEENTNTPEKDAFEFTIHVPAGVTGSFPYTVAGVEDTATVTDGKMTISLKDGQKAVFHNLPVGEYTVAETDFRPFGYNSYVSINGGAEVESLTAAVELTRGTTNSVAYQNKFPVGDLQIEKTVTKEFYGIPWDGDTFTFTVKRTDEDRPLIENNMYYVEIDGARLDSPAVVDSNGDLKVTITFDQEDADRLKRTTDHILHTLVIKDLPTGNYSVTEGEYPLYRQSSRLVNGLVIPADEAPKAVFSNELIRPTGSLYLEKELVPAAGYNPDILPEGTEFSFSIELTAEPPETATIHITNNDGSSASVSMTSGKFQIKLKAGQSVVMTGLPIGSYRITEATIPSYANSFAHKINGNWIAQPVTSTADGRMYTDTLVSEDQRSDVLCTNTYPVNRAELIIQKLVTKAYDRDTLPGESFTFTVTLEKEDAGSYDYKVYDQSSTEIKTGSVTVTDKRFSISLEAGQYAIFDNMPVCGYTVSETANEDYRTSYALYQSEKSDGTSSNGQLIVSGDGTTVTRIFIAGKTDKVVFTNEYKKHLGTLTVTKTVEGNPPTVDTFVFHIYKGEGGNMQKLMDVTIEGEGSITVYDLPLGNYTVIEDTSWNWRYTTTNSTNTAVLTVDDLDAQVGFTNTYRENKWLNFFWNRLNEFAAVPKGDDE